MASVLPLLGLIIGKFLFLKNFRNVQLENFSLRIWQHNGEKYELQSNVQGEHARSIYSVSWSDKGILTGSGDNFVRLFVEQPDGTWSGSSSIEVNSDINSGTKPSDFSTKNYH